MSFMHFIELLHPDKRNNRGTICVIIVKSVLERTLDLQGWVVKQVNFILLSRRALTERKRPTQKCESNPGGQTGSNAVDIRIDPSHLGAYKACVQSFFFGDVEYLD